MMEIKRELNEEQQQQPRQLVGPVRPVRPVQPAPIGAPPDEVCTNITINTL